MRVTVILNELCLCQQLGMKIALLWILNDWLLIEKLKLLFNVFEVSVSGLDAQIVTPHL